MEGISRFFIWKIKSKNNGWLDLIDVCWLVYKSYFLMGQKNRKGQNRLLLQSYLTADLFSKINEKLEMSEGFQNICHFL